MRAKPQNILCTMYNDEESLSLRCSVYYLYFLLALSVVGCNISSTIYYSVSDVQGSVRNRSQMEVKQL
jgi:hypothetical protein